MKATCMFGAGDVRITDAPEPVLKDTTAAVVRIVQGRLDPGLGQHLQQPVRDLSATAPALSPSGPVHGLQQPRNVVLSQWSPSL